MKKRMKGTLTGSLDVSKPTGSHEQSSWADLKIRILITAAAALIILLAVVFAGAVAPNDPYTTNVLAIRKAPCAAYPFGTDNLGRCVFSRVLYGGRTTIAATFFLVFLSFAIGTFIGMICGYLGGWADRLLMRIADILLSFPQMVVAIAVAGILNGGMKGAMIALGITMWVSFARLARSHTMSIRQEAYISSAVLAGKADYPSSARMFFRTFWRLYLPMR